MRFSKKLKFFTKRLMPVRFEAEQLFERIRHRWGRCIYELIRMKKHLLYFNAYLYVSAAAALTAS
jgi:hypothetical protein